MAKAVVKDVYPGSIGEEIGLVAGDAIISINEKQINDVLDYKYLTADDVLVIEILKRDGNTDVVEVETDYEDLGIEFENSLMDAPKHCQNKCIFCFIDQLPKGMRETVYFKDDDARLSFLQGNYITLTNLNQKDIDRLVEMRISPVNVSVHTTNSELRRMMLGNRKAGNVFEIMQYLAKNHIRMNCQIVLCYEINDKAELDRTLTDLASLHPYVHSISVVPVGLSAHRTGLCELKPFNKESSREVVSQIEVWQKKLLEKYGSRIVYIADEFYLQTGIDLPSEDEYEGFPQIENGIGLIASMKAEFERAVNDIEKIPEKREVSIATGEIAYPFIKELTDALHSRFPQFSANVYAIKNNFFGGGVSVSGLVCACDIIDQIKDKPLGKKLYIPISMLRDGDDVFLDNMSLNELENKLSIEIIPVENDGYEFIEKLLNITI